ncbi:hypothetical protein BDZ45DRAFT_696724 [Acephala macrosclerotiorum]|nr:hypothetical protein BDZ45DRAFT_696724 [Acephala macrosclerotiorum]
MTKFACSQDTMLPKFGKAYNQVNALYQLWLDSDIKEEPPVFEDAWVEDEEANSRHPPEKELHNSCSRAVRDEGLQSMDISPSMSHGETSFQAVASAHNVNGSQDQDAEDFEKIEAMIEQRNTRVNETLYDDEHQTKFEFGAKSRASFEDRELHSTKS